MTTQPEALQLPSVEMFLSQAKVYASAWSLVGSRFDTGNELGNAESEWSIFDDMVKRVFGRIAELEASLIEAQAGLEVAAARNPQKTGFAPSEHKALAIVNDALACTSCPVAAGTHKPAQALHAISEPADHSPDTGEMVGAKALDAREKRWLAIGQSVERACEELPEGAEIIVSLERDAGTVTMIDWDGNEHDNFPHDDGFAGVMNAAIDATIAAKQGAGNG